MARRAATAKGEKKTARKRRKPRAEAGSRGLLPTDLSPEPLAEIRSLMESIRSDGGAPLAAYRDPVGGQWQVLAALPVERVEPTPFQRDLSEAHVRRLANVIDKLDRFLDPIIAVRRPEGRYWTPNGYHRTSAVKLLGGRSITALVLPDEKTAYRILALNTEKAHNLREKSLEVIRMARDLSQAPAAVREMDLALEFEEAPYLTLGLVYEKRGRFSGGAYHPILKRLDRFLELPLPKTLEERAARAGKLLELDDAVVEAVDALKARGLTSPYLKAFVVARINPIRFQKPSATPPDFDETLAKMLAAARKLDVSKIRPDQLAASGGPPDEG